MKKISKKFKKLIKNNYKVVLLVVLAFLLLMGIISMSTNGTFSKYTNRSFYSHNVNSGKFIFNSDTLSEDESTNIIYNYNNENITFKIKNGNVTEYTNANISYNIACTTSAGTCTLSESTGTLAGTGVNENSHTFTITNTGSATSPITVTITVTSTEPYEKTLTGSFLLYLDQNEEISFDRVLVYENSYYCEYQMVNNSPFAINIYETFQDTQGVVSFDEESEFFKNKYYSSVSGHLINNIRTGIAPYSSQTLRYYKIADTSCSNIVHNTNAYKCTTPYAEYDIDNDGYITANDALAVLGYPKGLNACAIDIADVNHDSVVNNDDAQLILNRAVGN